MKKYLILGVALALFSCKKDSEAEVKTAPSQVETSQKKTSKDLNATSTTSEVVFENERFNKVYASYLAVKSALVNTDNDKASSAARMLFMSQKNAESAGTKLSDAIIGLQGANDIADKRIAFEKVTAAMEVEIAKQKITSGTIYKQYCPMAFDGKGGYWLSDSKEVRNPYYGDKMLTCGVVDSELN